MPTSRHVFICPHPGREATPPAAARGASGTHAVPWNTHGDHRRKFLRIWGRSLDATGVLTSAEHLVWCEYEPPTLASAIPPGRHGIASWKHQITRLPALTGTAACVPSAYQTNYPQNTDPWIWTDGFVWSVCRHHINGQLRDVIKTAKAGDVVLFGSSMSDSSGNKIWVLDTVLVIDHAIPVAPQGNLYPPTALGPSVQIYMQCVLHRIPTRIGRLRLLVGTLWTPEKDRWFSFAPALPESSPHAIFPRPDISARVFPLLRLRGGGVPEASNCQSLVRADIASTDDEFWDTLVDSVRNVSADLGVVFDYPAIPIP